MLINKQKPDYIELTHKGTDAHYMFYSNPMFISYPGDPLKEPIRTAIEFSDLKEIDNLIYVLSDFRKRCAGHIGDYTSNELLINEYLNRISRGGDTYPSDINFSK